MKDVDVVIVGGGPAGSVAAALLAHHGWDVLVLERCVYPRNKVCGGFLSPEGVVYLNRVGIDAEFLRWKPAPIHGVRLTSPYHLVETPLPYPGYGISRERLDTGLRDFATRQGATVYTGIEGRRVEKRGTRWVVEARRLATGEPLEIDARVVIGAFGVRSGRWDPLVLESHSQPAFVAFQTYIPTPVTDATVELHFFPGGYVGLGPVEGSRTNLCGLISWRQFRRPGEFRSDLLTIIAQTHPLFRQRLDDGWVGTEPLPCQIITVPPYGPRRPFQGPFFLIGDAAGTLHPFLGEGITAALQSAAAVAEIVDLYLRGRISLENALHAYATRWRSRWRPRFRWSGLLARLATSPTLLHWTMAILTHWPNLTTHLFTWTRDPKAWDALSSLDMDA